MESKELYIKHISQLVFRFLFKVDIYNMPVKTFGKMVDELSSMVTLSADIDKPVISFFFECIDLYKADSFYSANGRVSTMENHVIKIVTDALETKSITDTNVFHVYNKYIQYAKTILNQDGFDVDQMYGFNSYNEYARLMDTYLNYPYIIANKILEIDVRERITPSYKPEFENRQALMKFTINHISALSNYIDKLNKRVSESVELLQSRNAIFESIVKITNTDDIENWIKSYMNSSSAKIDALTVQIASMNEYIAQIENAYNNRDGLNNVVGWIQSLDERARIVDTFVDGMNTLYGSRRSVGDNVYDNLNVIYETAGRHTKLESFLLRVTGASDDKSAMERVDALVSLESSVYAIVGESGAPESVLDRLKSKVETMDYLKGSIETMSTRDVKDTVAGVRDIMKMLEAKDLFEAKRRVGALVRMAYKVHNTLYAGGKFDVIASPDNIISDLKQYDDALEVLVRRHPSNRNIKYTLGVFVELIETLSTVKETLGEWRKSESEDTLLSIVENVAELVSVNRQLAIESARPVLAIENAPTETNESHGRKRKKT